MMNAFKLNKINSKSTEETKNISNEVHSQKLSEKSSKDIALSLLKSVSYDDVKEVLDKYKDLFDNAENWQFNAKWATAGNQQGNPVGAFTELVINSMDACLIKKAKQKGIKDLRADDVPQSMQQAVKNFYPDISEGNIANFR